MTVKVFAASSPEQRVHVAGANVKFHDGEAEVSEKVAAALLALGGFSTEAAEAPFDGDVGAAVAAETARLEAEHAEQVKQLEADFEQRLAAAVAEAVENAAAEPVSAEGRSENGNPVSADVPAEPEKRKPGRPRKD